MTLFPTKAQWRKWTLPSKATYIGTILGVVGVLIAIVLFVASQRADALAGQPQLAIKYSSKPYLRYSTSTASGLELSYEICVENSGKHPATDLRYEKTTETLLIGSDVSIPVRHTTTNTPPSRLVSGERYCQIFTIRNTKITVDQIALLLREYDSNNVAIFLELDLRYTDAFTGKSFSLGERNKIRKDRVEIH